jgi:hypothetical protein
MGSLSNLYISQSYTSLIHLGNDTTITTASVQLQDGLGNGIGVFVNSLGNVSLSGSFTSSLEKGYTWVGDGNNRTTLVATSSFGGGSSINTGSFVTTSSFNSYTSSTDSSITQLNASSASQQISINALNSYTASNQPISTASFATTGSNTFIGNQTVVGNVKLSGSNDNHIYINRPAGVEVLRMGVSDNGNTFDFIITGSGVSPKDIWLIDNQGGTYGNTFLGFLQAEARTNINAPFTGSQGAQINGGNLVIQSGSNGLVVHGNKQFNVGAFQSNITQSGSAAVSQSMRFETTDISQGVSIVSNSRITLANSGTYNIQFSAQIDRISGSGTDTVNIWLKKNGTNVSSSAGAITVSGGAAAAKAIAAWNYVVDASAGDYYELAWQTTDTNIQLINVGATGNVPDIPSIILTVTQVR